MNDRVHREVKHFAILPQRRIDSAYGTFRLNVCGLEVAEFDDVFDFIIC
jgi:hypothetical protein